MYVLQTAKQDVLKIVKGALGKAYTPNIHDLETPPDPNMGNIAFPCFVIAKGMKKNPVELATEIAAKVAPKGLISKVQAKGPYVNFWIDPEKLAVRVLKEVQTAGDRFGFSTQGKGKRVMVEFANMNTHKDFHIGHLRNMLLGQAFSNVLAAAGYESIPHAYINDLGNNVARCLWAYENKHLEEIPEKGKENVYLQKLYEEGTKAMEKTKKAKDEISEIQRELESGKGPWVKLWNKTNKWSLDGFKLVFDDFGLKLVKIFLESDGISDTKKIVQDMIKNGIAVHSEGAWVVRLEDEDLGVNLLVKTDGTYLYNAKDLSLAKRKEEEYNPDRSVYVVDDRQKHVMAQLFATLKRMGFDKDLYHLAYGVVTLPEGAMSSRKGTIVLLEDVRSEMIELASAETKKRHKDWEEKKVNVTARGIAYAALKFSMLRIDPEKDVVFDVKESLSFEGFSGPYLLYVIARCQSLLEKSGEKPAEVIIGLKEPQEHALIRTIAMFPEIISKTASDYQVSRLAQYLFELGQNFNDFYAHIKVIGEENDDVRKSRLALTVAVAQTMKNGLGILGIETVDEM